MGKHVLLRDLRKIQRTFPFQAFGQSGSDVADLARDLVFYKRRNDASQPRRGKFVNHRLVPARLMIIPSNVHFSHL